MNQEVRYRETGESLSLLSRRQSPLIGSEEKFNSTHGEYSGTDRKERNVPVQRHLTRTKPEELKII